LNVLVVLAAYRGGVLEHRILLDRPDLRLAAVRCPGASGWSPAEQVGGPSIVLVRRGVFVRRVDGVATVADATTGYVQFPGEWQQVAHPAGVDVCTSIGVPGDLAERLGDAGPLLVDAAADLAHRRLLSGTLVLDATGVADLATDLLAALLPPARPAPAGAAARRLVDDVRAALHADPRLPLAALAAGVGWSPWYLSRTFHRLTGATIAAYRMRLRVRAALDELADGGADLAGVAARTGFADQAHMTRALRRETGLSPGAARRLFQSVRTVRR
jgi:AraC-like DNA-binding protein